MIQHDTLIFVLDARGEVIFPDFDPEIASFKQVADKMHALEPAAQVGRAPFELEGDIIFRCSFADQGFQGGKMLAQSGAQIAVVTGDHEVVLFGEAAPMTDRKGGVGGGLNQDRSKSPALDGRWSVPGNGRETLPEGQHGVTGD